MQIDQGGDVLVQSSLESQENYPASLNEADRGGRLANDLPQDVEWLFRKQDFGCLAGHHFLLPWKTMVKSTAPPIRRNTPFT